MWFIRVAALKITKTSYSVANTKGLRQSTRLGFLSSWCRFGSVNISAAEFMSTEPKRIRTENMTIKKIGTHNGSFHCDEVLACFFLRQLPEYAVGSDKICKENELKSQLFLLKYFIRCVLCLLRCSTRWRCDITK